ncbi:MAG: hypothetical protein ABIX01_09720 [Chitinophagaceae bacterium]
MKTVKEQQVVVKPTTEPGRLIMRLAIIVLVVSQFLPFSQGSASLNSRYTGRGHGTYENAYSDAGYETYVESGKIYGGFESHPYAVIILPVLLALFFTGLYNRPGWSKKLYWIAIIMAIGCTEMPPPIDSMGGIAGAIALALMAYSLYQRSTQKKEVEPQAA